MSANVDEMFSVRQMPWWVGTGEDKGQAHILGDHPSWQEARKLAGLEWEPVTEQLNRPADLQLLKEDFENILFNPEMLPSEQVIAQLLIASEKRHPVVPGWKHVLRDDNSDTLACTMDSYSVISNSDFGEIFTAVLKQDNVKFETGGSLNGGRQVWMLALLDEPIEIKGDGTITMPYLALMSRHDARGATTLRAINVRIVCANTFNRAEAEGESRGLTYSFIHRGDWRGHMDEAREAVLAVREETKAYKKLAEELLLVKVTTVQRERFLTEFFPMPPKGVASDRVIGNVEHSREAFRTLLAGKTIAGAGIDGTAYGLLQASTEYLDHIRRTQSWETHVNRTLLKAEPLKERALGMIRELVEA